MLVKPKLKTNSTETESETATATEEVPEEKPEEDVIDLISPDIIDLNGDNLEFNFTGGIPEKIYSFARVYENTQEGMIKTFTVSIDRASVVFEDLGNYNIVLNVTDDHVDEPVSVFFTFTLILEVPELTAEEQEEIIEQQVEKEKKENNAPAFMPKFEEPEISFETSSSQNNQ